jgi:hypothetical protein
MMTKVKVLLATMGMAACVWSVSVAAVGDSTRQVAPDVSGTWTRGSSGGGGDRAGWGPTVTIEQSDGVMTVRPVGDRPARYRTDGSDQVAVLANEPCRHATRVTRTDPMPRGYTITTWLVTTRTCWHGESALFLQDDPEDTAEDPVRSAFRGRATPVPAGPRKVMESVTTVTLSGDRLRVETLRPSPVGPQTTTAVYDR